MKNASQLSGASPSPVEDTTNTVTAPGLKTSAVSVSFMDEQEVTKALWDASAPAFAAPRVAASAAIALQISAALPV